MKNAPKDFVMRKNPKEFPFVVRNVSTAELRNINGQRLPKAAKISKIVENFDPNLVNIVKVSDRDGVKRIIDGDHTCIACKEHNNGEDCLILCKVFSGMTEEDERYYFIVQNGFEDDLTFNENMYALHEDKNPSVLRYESIIESFGMTINYRVTSATQFMPTCHKTLYNAYLADVDAFRDTISVLSKSYASKDKGLRNELCSAIFNFIYHYREFEDYDEKRLVRRLNLKQNSPQDVLDKGKARVDKSKYKYARQILLLYNEGYSNDKKLPDIFGITK